MHSTLRLATASTLTRPLLLCGRVVGASLNMICTWPPSRSFMAGALPL